MDDHPETPAFQRARSPEAKEQRRRALLDAASELLRDGGHEAVTLAGIAERAGVVKSGVYRYFESREEILMRLMASGLEDMAEEMEGLLPELEGSGDAETVAARTARAFAARPDMCELAGVLSTVLEHNVGPETLLEIKREMLGSARRIAVAGARMVPAVGAEGWALACRLIFSLVSGHWPLSHPPAQVAEVLAHEDFAPVRKDFEEDLRLGIAALLRGLAAGDAAPA
ncbi:MAG: TetR family transcriptional regulator [Pseudomonadota bacterium]